MAAAADDNARFKILCVVCMAEFNNGKKLPVSLVCGHTFCSSCVTYLIQRDEPAYCFTCRREIDKQFSSIRNLSILQACKTLTRLKDFTSQRFRSIRESMLLLEKVLPDVDRQNENISGVLNQLRETCEHVERSMVITSEPFRMVQPNIQVRNATDMVAYMSEVRKCIQTGMTIYYFANVGKAFSYKYGKVTLDNNMLLLHSQTLSQEPEDGELLISLELMKRYAEVCLGTFLRLRCDDQGTIRTVIMYNAQTDLGYQFASRCSGTYDGRIYKGRSFRRGESDIGTSIVEVDMMVNAPNHNSIELLDTPCRRNERIVIGNDFGDFNIIDVTQSTSIFNRIASVDRPENLVIDYSNESVLTIVDCGEFYEF